MTEQILILISGDVLDALAKNGVEFGTDESAAATFLSVKPRAFDTILAALRFYQRGLERDDVPSSILEISENEHGEPLKLEEIDAHKTGAMIEAACLMGCVCGESEERQKTAAREYARLVGLAFQIRDDMLDVSSTAQVMGKDVGSDAARGKTTFVTLLGADGCRKRVAEKTEEAKRAVEGVFPDAAFLTWMADYLMGREQ